MWSIFDLKQKAQVLLSKGYWKAVLVGFILAFAGGSSNVGYKYSGSLFGFITEMLAYFGAGNSVGIDYIAAAVATLLIYLFFFIIIFGIGLVFSLFVLEPLNLGCTRYFLLSCIQETNLGEIGFAYKSCYLNVVKISFFKNLYIVLWSLLFWIPGIIKSYEYRMIPYLMAENPTIAMDDAFKLSKKMMDGEKFRAFLLDLSFIGWELLNIFTCGILDIFYVTPYRKITNAELYFALRDKALKQ